MDNYGSDHLPCVVNVRRSAVRQLRKPPRAFKYDTDSEYPVSSLRKHTRSSPQTKRRVTQPPWWNGELDTLWLEQRSALKVFQRQPENVQLRELAKLAANTFKEEDVKAKREKYETFCRKSLLIRPSSSSEICMGQCITSVRLEISLTLTIRTVL